MTNGELWVSSNLELAARLIAEETCLCAAVCDNTCSSCGFDDDTDCVPSLKAWWLSEVEE